MLSLTFPNENTEVGPALPSTFAPNGSKDARTMIVTGLSMVAPQRSAAC